MNTTTLLDWRAAITDLIHRYAFNVRTRQSADCASLFTADAVFEVRETNPTTPAVSHIRKRLTGREEILDYITAAAGASVLVCPLIHNLLIDVNGDEATSNCIMTSRTWPAGYEVIGEYSDTFRREDSRWLFQSRTYTIFQTESRA